MSDAVKDCHYPWTWMMVTADGGVKPCCFATGTIGNLHDATAEEIWNGPIVVELRQAITQNSIHPVCSHAPCKFVKGVPASGPAIVPVADTPDQFDEAWYLAAYPDVAEAIRQGNRASGWDHYVLHGKAEGRRPRA